MNKQRKQRLMELAGIPSNMSNPSNEPGSGVPDNPSAYADTGEEGEGMDSEMERTHEEVRELAQQGMECDSVEEAHEYFQQILDLMGGGEEEGPEESEMGGMEPEENEYGM